MSVSVPSPSPTAHYARNVVYNLLGQVVPVAIGVLAVPILLHYLGVERVGLLTIAWLLVGYSGLVDLGLSRSITQITAEQIGSLNLGANHATLWTALVCAALLSLGAMAAGWVLMERIVGLLAVSPALQTEALGALRIFTLSIPAAVLTSIIIGFLTAYSRFGLINAIKVPTGVLISAGPLASVAVGSQSLVPVMAIMVGIRWLALGIFVWAAARAEPGLWRRPHFDPTRLRRLFGLGSWITVTNVVSPFLVYCDRFLISSLLSASVVAYYTTPQDAISRLLVLPVAMVTTLFPAIAQRHLADPLGCAHDSRRVMVQIFVFLFPVAAGAIAWANPALTLWVGAAFAARSTLLLQLFAVGILVNALAQVPATVLQAIGRPRWPALLHLLELGAYVPCAYWAVREFGLAGGAIAWVGRIVFDFLALNWAVHRCWPGAGALLRPGDAMRKGGLLAALIGVIALGDRVAGWLAFPILLIAFFLLYRRELAALLDNVSARFRKNLPAHASS